MVLDQMKSTCKLESPQPAPDPRVGPLRGSLGGAGRRERGASAAASGDGS